MNPAKVIASVPRVVTGGTDEQRSEVKQLLEGAEHLRYLKLGAAIALLRTGQKPHRKPPRHVIAKRRAKNKVAKQSRKANR